MFFDFIVVGKGLVGSATAKYLARSGSKVAVIGPEEPKDPTHGDVFSSHYDSSRVQRQIGRNEAMSSLNLQAVKEYTRLQAESGVRFHYPFGCLYVNSRGKDDYLEYCRSQQATSVHRTFFSESDLQQAFPYFSFPAGSTAVFEHAPSGYIDPRRLIAAQLRVVEKHSGAVIRKVVWSIRWSRPNVEVSTSDGEKYAGNKVIIAAGAFTNFYRLLSNKLELTLKSETVLLARADQIKLDIYSQMPSLLYEIETDQYEGVYIAPPAKYPDGSNYLKIGCNLFNDIYFDNDMAAIRSWFRGNDHAANQELLLDILNTLMPDHSWTDTQTKPCILTRTAGHGNPYIDSVDDWIVVAIGNGYSAMCSDGIGFVTAQLAQHSVFPAGFNRFDYQIASAQE